MGEKSLGLNWMDGINHLSVLVAVKPFTTMQIRLSILGKDGDWMVTDVIDDVGSAVGMSYAFGRKEPSENQKTMEHRLPPTKEVEVGSR